MPAPQLFPHYTVEDYQLWQGDWELWEGHPIAMSPSPFGEHQRIVSDLSMWFGLAIRESDCHAKQLAELDWIVCDNTIVRPDLMVVCGDAPEKHQMEPPALVAEVLSPSTRANDLNFKRSLYEAEGVPHYLIIDPVAASVSHLRLNGGVYQELESQGSVSIHICRDCDLSVDLTRLFAK
ncbi:MAG: Uma2 family endonuclease [Planctomycetota bacterium]